VSDPAPGLQVLLAVSFDGVALTSSDGTIIDANDRLSVLTDRRDGAPLTGASLTDLVVAADRGRMQGAMEATATGTISELTTVLVTHDDGERPVRIRLTPIDGIVGKPPDLAAVIHAVDDRSDTERTLAVAQRRFEAILDSLPLPIFVKDSDYRFIFTNSSFARLTGITGDVIGKTDYELVPKAEADVFRAIDERVLRDRVENENEETITDAAGRQRRVLTHKAVFEDSAGRAILVGVIVDITDQKRAEARLQILVDRDHLTGLANRSFLEEVARLALIRAQDQHDKLAVLTLDLDGFKGINDRFGHPAGDIVLKTIAERLVEQVRDSDVVARVGGDEFMVLLPKVSGPKAVADVARRLLAATERTIPLPDDGRGDEARISTSIGIALYPTHSDNFEGLTMAADRAMYVVKARGKGDFGLAPS
jgi:diguanylate cyclase (GGDEF)-like protein/PAS domain S-box-containing protein